MEEIAGKSTISTITALITAFLQDLYYPLRWFMLLAFVLILFDWRWTVAAAKKRGEKKQASRSGRQSINKMVDYFCWLTIAGLIEGMFDVDFEVHGIPIVQIILLILIYSFEIGSCYSNYCEARGIKEKWDIFGWIGKKTGLELIKHKRQDDE